MIPLAKPSFGVEEEQAVKEVLRSGWVTQGPKVKEFEDDFAAYTGAKHACAVSNCTAALHLALLGVGVKPGDVVITVSHSFIATANAIRHCNAESVFIDIEPSTYNIDCHKLAECLAEDCRIEGDQLYYNDVDRLAVGESPLCYCKSPQGRVAAILAVHQMGMPCDMKEILAIAKQYNLPVVEDAACAIGSEISFDEGGIWEKIGKPHGDVACFSFHPRKVLTTGDGGMLTTNNPELDKKFRLWRQHGMSITDMARHNAKNVISEEYLTTGFNYRMTDIQAAVGVEQLKKLDCMVSERENCNNVYNEILSDDERISLPVVPKWARVNWQSYPVRLEFRNQKHQSLVIQFLKDKGVATRRGIMNAHQERPYNDPCWSLPLSENAYLEVILLPLFSGLLYEEQKRVSTLLQEALDL